MSVPDTLPDYLQPGLDIVLVGLNPGLRSAQLGHYFANPRSRFWVAVTEAGLFDPPLDPDTDHLALEQHIGFTDVVKRPSRGSSDLRAADFRRWAPVLKQKLLNFQPRIVCFHGLTAYRNYRRYADNVNASAELGLQPEKIGESHVFVVPNPSPANAVFRLDDLVGWYRRLIDLRFELSDCEQ